MNEEFTIQDLCDQTGVPRRTIHFYTQQGILPPPQGAGLGAHYSQEHLLRLKLIPVYRNHGLRLDDIRQKFQTSSVSELSEDYAQSEIRVPTVQPILPVPAPVQKLVPTYTAYSLPHGMILMVPEKKDGDLDAQLRLILQAIQVQTK